MQKIKSRHLDWWLVGILGLATFLYAWKIWAAGSANSYYTAAITSMVQSWSNFWYGAFDPAGFITVDKPPIALWFMAISAKLFGIHGWSIVLPSVLFGIGSVGLMYAMVKPRFGAWAGRLSALVMTLTPIVVADSRTNNMDATLIFFLLLASFLLMRAVSRHRTWLVAVSFALIGVAFNIKMMQAFMILPAMYVFYWLASNVKWQRKLVTLVIATAALAGFTLAYPLAVDSTSASSRPYIGSSQTNSLLELAFGYNGTERLLGQTTGTGAAFAGMGKNTQQQAGGTTGNNGGGTPPSGTTGNNGGGTPPSGTTGNTGGGTPPSGTTGNNGGTAGGQAGTTGAPTQGGGQPGGTGQGGPGGNGQGGNNAFAIGTAGPLRLLQSDLGPQISWLAPVALIGLISAFAYFLDRKKRWYQTTEQQNHLLFWAAWLVPVAGFFSIASFFHPYYMIMLAPPLAALSGIGLVTMFRQFQRSLKHWTGWLLPIAFTLTMALQVWYVSLVYTWQPWALAAISLAALAAMFGLRTHRLRRAGIAITLATLLAAPGWWALTPTLAGESSAIPYASPTLLQQGSQGGDMAGSVDSGLLSYIQQRVGSATYLFATSDANSAAPYIIKTGKAVMATGGYNGTDPAITLKQFKQLVKNGEIKFYLASQRAGSNDAIAKWVQKVGKKIASSKYNTTTTTNSTGGNMITGGMGGGMGGGTLYQLTASMVD
ncbi:ArnT family glycosyltransferase [Lacticaseibacillus absianus]|uniref:ArnT family glycosyltransferase n=1 Tax=Lacticaseibacillus absianus TaxID=2729623 RepID=UPI0015CBC5CF|nr:glycosyltransferase family 39 protein [Lacticaseibacillus absianus]